MLKKTVTYEDPFTGTQVTEDLYFNLTKAEIVEMEMSVEGGLKEHLEGVARAENGSQIMQEMKGIILKAYGKRSGNSFIKNDQVREEFESSEAYSTMFMEMVTDADAAVTFVSGIMPKDLESLGDPNQEKLALQDQFAEKLGTREVDRPNLTAVAEPRLLTQEELVSMDREQLKAGLASGEYKLA